jgi:cation diffusion facilitator family transporter
MPGYSTASKAPEVVPTRAIRYVSVTRVLLNVLVLNVVVAAAKIGFGIWSGAVSILSDGFHSLTDSASNVVALIGVRAARQPADEGHPYGHRKFETLAAAAIFVFLLIVLVQVVQTSVRHLRTGSRPRVDEITFAVMIGTIALNLVVVWYESRSARRLHSELLMADSMHTRSDVYTSLTVIGALIGVRMGWPLLDAVGGLVVAAFIGHAGFRIARETSNILTDRVVMNEADVRGVVMSVPEVMGCHEIRTRGSSDHVFMDLHVWFRGDMPLDEAHRLSHVVKDRLMAQFPAIADVIIHIEPPLGHRGERVRG